MDVDKTKASAIMNGQENIYTKIKKGTDKTKVTNTIEKYFTDKILPRLNQTMLKDLIYGINQAVQKDLKISKETRDFMVKHAEEKTAALFLSKTFLLALTRPNKTATAKPKSHTRSQGS